MEAFFAGMVAGYGIAIPVGAIAVLIVEVGIRCGFRCGFSAGAGAATADLIYAALAVVGGAALAGAVRSIDEQLQLLSALVLIAIAIVGLRRVRNRPQPVSEPMPDRRELVGTYARFLGLTIINPATVVYFAAVIVGLGVADDLTPPQGAWFVVGAFLASLSWQTLLAGLGGLAGDRLSDRAQKLAIVFGNLVILAFAAAILLR